MIYIYNRYISVLYLKNDLVSEIYLSDELTEEQSMFQVIPIGLLMDKNLILYSWVFKFKRLG